MFLTAKLTPKFLRSYSNEKIDYAQAIADLFVKTGASSQTGRIKGGQCPARRAVFLKPHGVVHGTFEVLPDLPKDLKVGIFDGKQSYPTWIRFSSDTIPLSSDANTTVGIGIKLFGVKGKKLIDHGETQDFILQNFDVFFVDTAKDMYEFTKAGVVGHDYDPYLKTHPVTNQIINDMGTKSEQSVYTTYWSCLPYAFGSKLVKYKLEPSDPVKSVISNKINVPNYLATELKQRLIEQPMEFKFMVQFQKDHEAMPLDKATVRWDEKVSPPIHIATLKIPQQDLDQLGTQNYGENLAFNPWHSLKEHQPQGSISEARKVTYKLDATRRHLANGIPDDEPLEPRQVEDWNYDSKPKK